MKNKMPDQECKEKGIDPPYSQKEEKLIAQISDVLAKQSLTLNQAFKILDGVHAELLKHVL